MELLKNFIVEIRETTSMVHFNPTKTDGELFFSTTLIKYHESFFIKARLSIKY